MRILPSHRFLPFPPSSRDEDHVTNFGLVAPVRLLQTRAPSRTGPSWPSALGWTRSGARGAARVAARRASRRCAARSVRASTTAVVIARPQVRSRQAARLQALMGHGTALRTGTTPSAWRQRARLIPRRLEGASQDVCPSTDHPWQAGRRRARARARCGSCRVEGVSSVGEAGGALDRRRGEYPRHRPRQPRQHVLPQLHPAVPAPLTGATPPRRPAASAAHTFPPPSPRRRVTASSTAAWPPCVRLAARVALLARAGPARPVRRRRGVHASRAVLPDRPVRGERGREGREGIHAAEGDAEARRDRV